MSNFNNSFRDITNVEVDDSVRDSSVLLNSPPILIGQNIFVTGTAIIALNAGPSGIFSTGVTSGLFAHPVRSVGPTGLKTVYYNTSTFELSYEA